ncbi:BofC C-terminal domain-containing protein [Dethiothermospora halolimnae]|uniref:BofC C-terminal domain-containing protein n=1 Tax=Dethiothermospora halolimnae TaxID=3114390 RepID=UPI003CCBC889
MKRNFILPLIITCVVLLTGGLIFGYIIGSTNIEQKPRQDEIIYKGSNDGTDIEQEAPFTSNENKCIGPNTEVVYKTHYRRCGHTIEEKKPSDDYMVNMTEEQLNDFIIKEHPSWKLKSFSNDKIVIEIEKNHLCPEHYIIGIKDGNLAIYKVNKDGEKILKMKYKDSNILMLKKIDQEKLERGIVVDSLEEVDSVLEDYMS